MPILGAMGTIVFLTIPGLVILLVLVSAIELIRAKVAGRKPRGIANVGMNTMDLIFRPGSENKIQYIQSKKIKRKTDGDMEKK